jgi:UDP-glucose 4-epimerase
LNILVTGGAGYIGSVTALMLLEQGHRVTVLDNLSSGHRDAVDSDILVEGNVSDTNLITEICRNGIDVVMHFAARIEVAESVKNPALYYENNTVNTIRLLTNLLNNNVKKMVFSSTAAVYGNPGDTPLTEEAVLQPISPYGHTKMITEQVLRDFNGAYDFRSVSLRYFNAGGAYNGRGENHKPETHLIPRVLDAIANNGSFTVFGTDYPTPDGTCIRDYIHVVDIARAHMLAMDYLLNDGPTEYFNIGTGKGYSVLEVIDTAERVTGQKLNRSISNRREGDSAVLVASPNKAQNILGFPKELISLEQIISSAWEWKQKFPRGYQR